MIEKCANIIADWLISCNVVEETEDRKSVV